MPSDPAASGAGPACPLSPTSCPQPDAHSGVTALGHGDAPVSHPVLCGLPTCCLPVCVLSQVCLCEPGAWSPPSCSVHRILQASILEWVVISPPGDLADPMNPTHVPCIAGRFFSVPLGKSQEQGNRTSTSRSGRVRLSPSQSAPWREGSVTREK